MFFALQFAGGLVLLLVGGRLLVSASIDAARRFGVSPMVVGLTLVAWGTSAPELALNLISATKGRGDLALGNIVGANICNMALVLGLCALIRPLYVGERLIRVEMWLNVAILLFMAFLGLFSGFQRWEAGLMLAVFAVYSGWTVVAALRASRRRPADAASAQIADDPGHTRPPMGWIMIASCFVGGLALLSYGGSLASDGASGVALALGVPPAIVGVTIVSIGTTLPELITGVLAIRKGQTDLAMGNALGSCLFNAGAIFGVSGLVAPPTTDGSFVLPLVYMGLLSIAIIPVSRTGRLIARIEGAALLASYAAFLTISAVGVGSGAAAAAFPTKEGSYVAAGWRYDYAILARGSRSERRIGTLLHDGVVLGGAPGDVRETPLGRFAYFGLEPGHYNVGWLNTMTYDTPVFGADGALVADVAGYLAASQPAGP